MSEGHASDDSILYWPRQDIVVDDFDAAGYILDIGGGGEGVIGQLKGDRVIAIDKQRRELDEAAPGGLKIVMDATDLKFLDSTFQCATAFFSLMYIKDNDIDLVFGEAYRVLVPGGRFLIWDAVLPTRPDTDKDVVAVMLTVKLPGREIETGYGTPWPSEERSSAYYAQSAQNAGFDVVAQRPMDRLFYLELRKPLRQHISDSTGLR
ncbi:MAG: class I SAM-dependent methyltransferase [Anaerolineae bacterium]|jgi:ubiquinone/menaquinone biosynthesis C-methylase UbiE